MIYTFSIAGKVPVYGDRFLLDVQLQQFLKVPSKLVYDLYLSKNSKKIAVYPAHP
jgi:hypothetical protein